eukprot:663573_1
MAKNIAQKSEINEDKLEDVEEEFATSWSDPNWFQTYPLHHNSIYDYFQHPSCPFYDNECNNNIVLQQQMGFANFEEQLANLKGTEYKVDFETRKHDPEYTAYNVIYKYNRLSPKQTELQRIYYCPGIQNHPQFGSIFPMPSINMVFNNKMRNAVFHLNKSMEIINDKINKQDIDSATNKKKKKKKTKHVQTNNDEHQITQRNQYSSLVDGLIIDMQK